MTGQCDVENAECRPETHLDTVRAELQADQIAQAKRIIEGVLFASSDPVPLHKLCGLLQPFHPFEKADVRTLLEEMATEYSEQNRAFRLEEIAKGYLLRTTPEVAPYVQAHLHQTKPERLSQAAAEVLAIVAYRQPITRQNIDEIRGVDSSGVVYSLMERGLIEPVGKLEAPGRPTLLGVTKQFLRCFGINDVKELPHVE